MSANPVDGCTEGGPTIRNRQCVKTRANSVLNVGGETDPLDLSARLIATTGKTDCLAGSRQYEDIGIARSKQRRVLRSVDESERRLIDRRSGADRRRAERRSGRRKRSMADHREQRQLLRRHLYRRSLFNRREAPTHASKTPD